MAKLITYDLCNKDKDYEGLTTAIKQLSGYAKLTESCWVVNSSKTCTVIRDALSPYIDSDDRIFVANLSGSAAWKNMISSSDKVKEMLNS